MLAYVRSLGGGLVYIHPMSGGVDPGYGMPDWAGGRPDNSLPGGGHIDNSLPGSPAHPDNRPPSHPPHVPAGVTLVLVRDPAGVWHYATVDASTPPPKPLPVPPPNVAGQPLPPTATPKA